MPVFCPDCDSRVDLPEAMMTAGVPKLRCSRCGCRYAVLPGGTTMQVTASSGEGDASGTGSGGAAPASSGRSRSNDNDAGFWGPLLTVNGPGPAPEEASPAIRSDLPPLPPGTVIRGKWRIEAQIGRGATAIVYRAVDLDSDLAVALKVVGAVGDLQSLRQAWADEFKARLAVADGRHLLRLESPVQESRDGVNYVVLPQELGELSLRQWLDRGRADLPGRQAEGLALFAQLCRGVEALHAARLAHLDLKPENIVLVAEAGAGEVRRLVAKVGDFGLARAQGSRRRREGMGTPLYMAPEQVHTTHEKEIGPWSDIYALGCMLFEILDGDPPFSGTAVELRRKHLETPPRKLRGVSPHLQSVVLRCLAKDRDERPESVRTLREAIEQDPAEEAAHAQAQAEASEAGWRRFLEKGGQRRHGDSARQARRFEVRVPDIGGFKNVPVIELLVQPGASVRRDQCLVTLESDKATMEVPAPVAGIIEAIKVKVGDEVSEGSLVALIKSESDASDSDIEAAHSERSRQSSQMVWPRRGEVYDGVVEKVMDFGAFVDIGEGRVGLLHISQIPQDSSTKPDHERDVSDYLTVGQSVVVKVLDIDREHRMRLSMLGLPQPTRQCRGKVIPESSAPLPGELYDGVVGRVMSFGAFVEIGSGLAGLVHTSQIPQDCILSVGQAVVVRVVEIDRKLNVRLSMLGVPQPKKGEKYVTLADILKSAGQKWKKT